MESGGALSLSKPPDWSQDGVLDHLKAGWPMHSHGPSSAGSIAFTGAFCSPERSAHDRMATIGGGWISVGHVSGSNISHRRFKRDP